MIFDHSPPVIAKRRCLVARRGAARKCAGFALLIAIMLVSLLVLILVGLASFTRVETQVSVNSQQQAQARQNALMALNIALGQLQKYTGPDQRTTARADIDIALARTTAANGRWLAAYGNGAPVDTTYTLKPSQIPANITASSDSKGSQAKLLNWLVSGNERTAFDPASHVDANGRIVTAPASIAYTPASTINLTTATATPAATDTQALLVGENSATASSDYVAAPLVKINGAAGTVPGLTTEPLMGRYAWWVGDEGAKARVNMPMASVAQAPAAFVSAQRAAIELMDGKNEVGSTNATDLIGTAAYDSALPALAKLVSPKQLSLLTPAAAATTLPAALKVRFHDLTAASTTVLADAYAGGLKKDLSAVLANKAAVDVGTDEFRPLDTDYLFTPEGTGTDSLGVPTWGRLRSFVQTVSSSGVLPDSSSVLPDSRLATPTRVGISPVLTNVSLGLKYVAPDGVSDGKPIRMAVFPLVVLWNPYTSTIPQHTFEVGIVRRYGLLNQSTILEVGVENSDGSTTWTTKETISFNRNLTTSGGTANTYIRFKVQLPAGGIPAGASLVFSLPTGGADYNTPTSGPPVHTLTNGLNAGGYVLAGSATLATGEASRNFRVSGMIQGGELCAYLGEVSSAGTTGTASYLNDNGSNNYQWHQHITRLSPGVVNGTGSYWQGPLEAGNFFDQPISGVLYPSAQMTCDIQMSFGELTNPQMFYPNVRWIAQSNPRAGIQSNTPTAKGLNPVNFDATSGKRNWPLPNLETSGLRASSGVSLDSATAIVDTTLFEFRPDTQPLLSLGQLQQADLSLYSAYPAYAVGNSLADFRFVNKRDQVLVRYTMTNGIDNPPTTQMTSYYDVSWLLNRVLWDRYFVSTVPNKGTGTAADSTVTASTAVPDVLPNPRLVKYGTAAAADLHDADKAAANLLLKGGFNINSTSEQAWRAVLGGINQLDYDPEGDGTSGKLKAALPRFAKPTVPGNPASVPWQGYRALDESQIARLATTIVVEIRNRGPFVSLADFVNRRLVDSTAAASGIDERTKGVIQAALDAITSGAGAINTATAPFDVAPIYPIDPAIGIRSYPEYDTELMQGGTTATAPVGSVASFAPQFVTQADVLSAIGAGLSARSDTFTIRTYGESVNPVTENIIGRAWCEAVVQRLPEYVKDTSPSSAAGDPAITAPASLQNTDNQKFGRRYKIISFRWLSLNDI